MRNDRHADYQGNGGVRLFAVSALMNCVFPLITSLYEMVNPVKPEWLPVKRAVAAYGDNQYMGY